MEKKCEECGWWDEYFGDCCHPESGGPEHLLTAIDECLKKDHAWWVERGRNETEDVEGKLEVSGVCESTEEERGKEEGGDGH